MTNEEKQELITKLKLRIAYFEELQISGPESFSNHQKDTLYFYRIALVNLTAQPVISDDTKRMDWLCAHCVEVRYPLMYGSREMFRAQQDSEEWDLPHHTTLREQVDAAIANEVQE